MLLASVRVVLEGVIGDDDRSVDLLGSYKGFTGGCTNLFFPTCAKSVRGPACARGQVSLSVRVCVRGLCFCTCAPGAADGAAVPDVPGTES